MDDRKWDNLSEGEFDAVLGAGLPDLPPEEIVEEVTPWKRAMNRVLVGMALSTVTLNFWLLDTILPAIGVVLMLLGFRSLRLENRWFRSCFVLALIRAIYFFLLFDPEYHHLGQCWRPLRPLGSAEMGQFTVPFGGVSLLLAGVCGRCGKKRGFRPKPGLRGSWYFGIS